ncbi:hypothetical protein N9O22_02180 [Gammaproteobacteria bacterium]|nr:hypothetical protein [Gammaproteobacteria bacterium]
MSHDIGLQNIQLPYKKRPDVPYSINSLELSEEIIQSITPLFNKLHGVNFDARYWSLLLQPHIQLILERTYDRFEHFYNYLPEEINYPHFSRINNDESIARDPLFWYWQNLDNEIIINNEILKYIDKCEDAKINTHSVKLSMKENYFITLFHPNFTIPRLKAFIKRITSLIATPIKFLKRYIALAEFNKQKDRKVFLVGSFLSKDTEIRLKQSINFGKFSLLTTALENKHGKYLNKLSKDLKLRYANFRNQKILITPPDQSSDVYNLFLDFIAIKILSFIPVFCVEEFHNYRMYFKDISSKCLICNSVVFWDPISRHAISDQLNRGAQIQVFQHGGGYGLQKYDSWHNLEKKFADQWIGWSNSLNSNNVITRESLMFFEQKTLQDKVSLGSEEFLNDILIIGPFFKEVHSYNISMHPFYNRSVAGKLNLLIKALEEKNFSVRYRPYGWREDAVSLKRGKRLGPVTSIYDDIQSSRIIICSKTTTAVNDCLACKRVPVLFFDFEENLNEFAIKKLDSLRQYKLYFSDPSELAENLTMHQNYNFFTMEPAILGLYDQLFGIGIASREVLISRILAFIDTKTG